MSKPMNLIIEWYNEEMQFQRAFRMIPTSGMKWSESVSHSVVSNSLQSYGL